MPSDSAMSGGLLTLGLDTDTVKLTVKTLSSHLITQEFNSPINFSRTPYVCVEPYLDPATPPSARLPPFFGRVTP
eukprot:1177561-Prorocentrum_minimum.AAC.1